MLTTPEKSITYDQSLRAAVPQVGQYLVSIGAKTDRINTVYTILSVAVVRPRVPRSFIRYRLTVRTCPGAKDQTIYHRKRRKVWVAGTAALPLFWYPRTKKKKR